MLEGLGFSPEIVSIATYYTLVMIGRLPARIITDLLTQYFSGLRMVVPGIVSSLFGIVLNAVLLVLVAIALGGGFVSVPIITTFVQWAEVAVLFGICWFWLRIYADYWPASGWSWANITWTRVVRFSKINFPAGLAMSSGCWRQAVIAVFASGISSTSVLVYSSAYRLTYLFIIVTSGFNGAMVVRCGGAFGANFTGSAKLTMRVHPWPWGRWSPSPR